MSRFQPHGARILCVAGSEGEFPEAVRQWLAQVTLRTEYCSDVYDALAVLATGTRPILVIVGIDSVDWSEMDFFSHVAALSRGTRIYVAAHDASDGRVFAAGERGARLFDPASANADIEAVFTQDQASGPGGLLAGTLRPSQVNRQPVNVPPATAEQNQPPALETFKTKTEEPPIRLVTAAEPDENSDVELSVPWAPHPSRPRRTPPKGPADAPQPSPRQTDGGIETDKPLPRVELTPDEIAALLGKPGSSPRLREQGS